MIPSGKNGHCYSRERNLGEKLDSEMEAGGWIFFLNLCFSAIWWKCVNPTFPYSSVFSFICLWSKPQIIKKHLLGFSKALKGPLRRETLQSRVSHPRHY